MDNSLKAKSLLTESKQKTDAEVKQQWLQVTVKYLAFEGGFYGLVSAQGKKLLPMNLKKSYQRQGTRLKVKGYFIKDMMTTQQWGEPFKITELELIELGQGNSDTLQ